MIKRHKNLVRGLISIMKLDEDYESIDEIRIINDGGGTGTFVVGISFANRPNITAAAVALHDPSAEAESIDPEEYFELYTNAAGRTEFN